MHSSRFAGLVLVALAVVAANGRAVQQAADTSARPEPPSLLPPLPPVGTDTFPTPPVVRDSAQERSVLVIEQGDGGRQHFIRFMTGMRARLVGDSLWPVTVYLENLDLLRFPSAAYNSELRGWLRRKYRGRHPDVVFAGGPGALEFVLGARDELWPGVPVVFNGVDARFLAGRRLPVGVTGQTLAWDAAGTLRLARQLFPDTRYVVLVGDPPTPLQYEQFFVRDVRESVGDLELVDLSGLEMAELRRRLAALPPNSIVLHQGIVRDRSGRVWSSIDAARAIESVLHVPFFSSNGVAGAVGGSLWDADSLGVRAAEQILEVLHGRDPSSIPVAPARNVVGTVVDHRQLERWGIPKRRIPAEAEVRFRPPSLWSSHREWLLWMTGLLVAQAATIGVLLVHRRQRRSAQSELEELLRADALIAGLSTSLRDLPPEDVDTRIMTWLERIGRFLEVDRAVLAQIGRDGRTFEVTHHWTRNGSVAATTTAPSAYTLDDFPVTLAALRAGRPWCFASVDELPAEAEIERAPYQRNGARSVATIPLLVDGETVGCIGFATRLREREWPDGLIAQLQLMSDLFAGALVRKRIEAEARKNEAFSSAMLASAARCAAIVDRDGVIARVSDDWRAAVGSKEGTPGALVLGEVGADYEELCRGVAAAGTPEGHVVARGVEAVLAGRQRRFTYEYTVGSPHGAPTWHEMTVERFDRHGGGAVISHLDITVRRRAEATAARQQRQVEHVARVATVGELAASIAHELNQPLGAILNNVHTAAFLLERDDPPIAEVRTILADIAADDQRAATIIRHVRKLLRRDDAEGSGGEVLLDVNDVVRGIQQLLSAESVRRRVHLEIDCQPDLPRVTGDRVQFEQVLLNLVMNAFDAVRPQGPDGRRVIVRTRHDGSRVIEVEVQDTGPGIPPTLLERMFEPFYTTKREGLGLGLSISRSIVEAHGGELTAENAPGGGAIIRFTWPATPRVSPMPPTVASRAALAALETTP